MEGWDWEKIARAQSRKLHHVLHINGVKEVLSELNWETPYQQEGYWIVTVSVDGVDVVTIEEGCLSGLENVSDYRKQILTAADHLIAFIGREDGPYFDFPPDDTP